MLDGWHVVGGTQIGAGARGAGWMARGWDLRGRMSGRMGAGGRIQKQSGLHHTGIQLLFEINLGLKSNSSQINRQPGSCSLRLRFGFKSIEVRPPKKQLEARFNPLNLGFSFKERLAFNFNLFASWQSLESKSSCLAHVSA